MNRLNCSGSSGFGAGFRGMGRTIANNFDLETRRRIPEHERCGAPIGKASRPRTGQSALVTRHDNNAASAIGTQNRHGNRDGRIQAVVAASAGQIPIRRGKGAARQRGGCCAAQCLSLISDNHDGFGDRASGQRKNDPAERDDPKSKHFFLPRMPVAQSRGASGLRGMST